MAGAAELTAGDDAKRRAQRLHRHRLEHHPPARGRAGRHGRCARSSPGGCSSRCVSVDGGAIDPETVTVLAAVVAAQAAARARVRGRAHPRGRDGRDPPRRQPRRALRRDPPRGGAAGARPDDAEEARLAFAGAVGTLPAPPGGTVGVVDVGGGSTELVAGTAAGGVSWFVSVRVGSGFLAERHVRGDPPTAAELDALRAARRRRVRGPRGAARRRRPTRSAAARRRCAGSAATSCSPRDARGRAVRRRRRARSRDAAQRARARPRARPAAARRGSSCCARRPSAFGGVPLADRARRPARGRRARGFRGRGGT